MSLIYVKLKRSTVPKAAVKLKIDADNNIISASNNYEQILSFANGEHAAITARSLSYAHHATQYTGFPSLGSLDTIAISSQTNHSGVFRFEIRGSILTSSPYAN
ncbi:hypothetical protein C1645_812653 [Glomus cerebriforme]|uniref:Uncharacterized protein n=1 Tax=Glomus cerebriforme TaxID=658196 RepID=A0A397TKT7_9GLOM|nr:hypothetical protein C1645_812653 [Glomus cerebriforme]